MDIQSLIDDIDGILPKAGSRLPWSKPGDAVRDRQVLERVRSYLVSQQQIVTSRPPQNEVVQQLVQAMSQEMEVVRADWRQQRQSEIEALRQQRQSLVQEIKQLECTKQEMVALRSSKQIHDQFIAEFSQELMSRCTTSLTQQIGLLLEDWGTQKASTTTDTTRLLGGTPSQGRLEQLQQLQAESDRLLTSLDTNQRVIFETLQSNLQSYQDSLSQGLDKMHNLGIQGEMLFTALINRLAQQLGREASTLLQSSREVSEVTPTQNKTQLPGELIDAGQNTSAAKLPLLGQNRPSLLQGQLPLESNQNQTKLQPSVLPALTDGNVAENLSSVDWEIIEGLDAEGSSSEVENDNIDTFLQLDLDTANQTDSQDLNDLLELINESSTSATPLIPNNELTTLDALNQAAQLNIISDQRRQEIDDLYKSLFGGDSLINTVKPDELDHAATEEDTPTHFAALPLNQDDLIANIEAVNLSPKVVEDVLFEGLTDPAIQTTQGQAEDWSTRQSSESWEGWFFADAANLSVEAALEGKQLSREPSFEKETLTTISTLTDLLEEMGLSYEMPPAMAVPLTNQAPYPKPSNPEPEVNLVEEQYIPALPEEDLLATEELESEPDREIRLDQNTLQQLSYDLHSFEDAQSGSFQRQDVGLPLGDDTAAPDLPSDRFLRSDELLAEDWEEFTFPNWPEDDLTSPNLSEVTSDFTATTQADHQAAGESRYAEELDFEPDLFPSETLELDHASVNGVVPSALTIPEALIGFEDEIVIDEMEWDELTDDITEEAIAPTELELVSETSPVLPPSQPPDTGIVEIAETPVVPEVVETVETPVMSEVVEAEAATQQSESLNTTQEATSLNIPEDLNEPAVTLNSQQNEPHQGLLAPSKEILNEDAPHESPISSQSDNLTEASQNSESVNIAHVDIAQPELNPQLEPEKKKQINSEANS